MNEATSEDRKSINSALMFFISSTFVKMIYS